MAHESINAQQIFYHWKDICKSKNKELYNNWDERSTYTSIVMYYDNSILKQLSDNLGLRFYCEYYSIDAVLYKDEDLVIIRPDLSTWLQRIRIAFEHEHDITTTYQEVSHLLITSCDLRVLVTYPDSDDKIYLKNYREMVRSSKDYKFNSFLIIFGRQSDNDIIDWVAYEFKNDDWITLF